MRSIRLKGGVFLDARFSAPWAVSSYVTSEDCGPILAKPSQMIAYHLLLQGSMMVSVNADPAIEVSAGELVVLPRNDVHVLASAQGIAPCDGHHLIQLAPDGGLARIDYGGGGEPAHMICGFLGCDDFYNPLIAALPCLLTIDVREAASRGLIEASMAFAAGEIFAGRLASSDVLSRLSELLLIEAIRRYAEQEGERQTGWLKGLRDPRIGRALALMHEKIAAAWTVEDLAKQVGMSRSAFVDRFGALVGMPPNRYLTSWRMETAKLQLRETTKSVSQIAYMIGYESEEAFSRAFKREIGLAPALWREQQS